MVQLQWYTPAGAIADADYWGNGNNHSIAWQIDGTEFRAYISCRILE
jgi:glycogen operon protein